MIDGFIMRDPGSYDDIMDILVDEKVVTEEEGTHLKQFISYRKNWFSSISWRTPQNFLN